MRITLLTLLALAGFACAPLGAAPGRALQSLDGSWQIADGKSPTQIPAAFTRTVPVPGLANLAKPAFPDVDKFISRENLANRIRSKLSPDEWLTNYWKGKVDQDRDYFWYRKTFRAPARRDVALLKINKAQFGTAVWLNGQKLGESAGCFTASYTPLDQAIRWGLENTLVVRIGAHPAVLPDTYPTGSDFEKIRWTPGIYDSVSVMYCDNPVMETIQVAPRIASSEVLVQTRLKNHGAAPIDASLAHTVTTWKGGKKVATGTPESVSLQPGEEKVVNQSLKIPDAQLWSPEAPFLYVVESSTGGDSVRTRFGMREFRFDAATRRAYLNGKVYYLRGSNITLHRFFEDPLCRDLPWKDAWVHKLLGDLPKRMHWNYFRFCIGPVPDRWLDICDEEGLLLQNEFFVWTGGPGWYKGYSRTHDADEMIRQYKDWMRDNWNHPSVAVWDANNETKDDIFGAKIIPAVRSLDLSDRPWENSYNPPAGPNDPVEHHPYLMSSGYRGQLTFGMTNLETMDSTPHKGALPSDTNPRLINEYGWLWLNRDGSPTLLTENVYAQLMGTNVTARERLDRYAYLLGAKTEFWRAHRQYAGIIHFVYLTCSYPGVYTADHFADVTKLKLDPAFLDYLGEAFKPLGVYINFFQPTIKAGVAREFTVMLVNDEGRPLKGQLTLTLETKSGKVLARAQQPFNVAALGAEKVPISLPIRQATGACVLKAVARAEGPSNREATVSRRWLSVTE
jgi:beta-galactosidase